jgi:acetoin utilization protein AcuB
MLVKNWMTKPALTIETQSSMQDAVTMLRENNIKMLPVLQKGRLVGIITDRDLKRASASDATTLDVYELAYLLNHLKVKEIMSPNPITVPQDFTIEETAEIFLKNNISGAPVTDESGNVVGVITQADIFRVLISLTGVGKRGVQFAFEVEDRPGSIREVADIIREYGGRMVSILTSYENAPAGWRRVYIRMFDLDRPRLRWLKEALSGKQRLLYMVDHRENRREIYIEP